MTDIVEIQEGDQHPVRIRLVDADGDAISPTTLRFHLRCEATGTVLSDWTALAASPSVELTIPSALNGIVNDANPFETKCLTVQADSGLPTQLSVRYRYNVWNNAAYT